MIIKDDNTTPEEDKHSYKFEEFGGLYTWTNYTYPPVKVWIMKPHLDITCRDCGWKTSVELKRKETKVNLKHECKVEVTV